jgi:hypothetical protein
MNAWRSQAWLCICIYIFYFYFFIFIFLYINSMSKPGVVVEQRRILTVEQEGEGVQGPHHRHVLVAVLQQRTIIVENRSVRLGRRQRARCVALQVVL